jgi:hypothetical protein
LHPVLSRSLTNTNTKNNLQLCPRPSGIGEATQAACCHKHNTDAVGVDTPPTGPSTPSPRSVDEHRAVSLGHGYLPDPDGPGAVLGRRAQSQQAHVELVTSTEGFGISQNNEYLADGRNINGSVTRGSSESSGAVEACEQDASCTTADVKVATLIARKITPLEMDDAAAKEVDLERELRSQIDLDHEDNLKPTRKPVHRTNGAPPVGECERYGVDVELSPRSSFYAAQPIVQRQLQYMTLGGCVTTKGVRTGLGSNAYEARTKRTEIGHSPSRSKLAGYCARSTPTKNTKGLHVQTLIKNTEPAVAQRRNLPKVSNPKRPVVPDANSKSNSVVPPAAAPTSVPDSPRSPRTMARARLVSYHTQ